MTQNALYSPTESNHALKQTLRTIDHWIHTILLWIASIALLAMVAIVFYTVFLRFVLNTGLAWAEEVPRILVITFAFIAWAMGVRDHLHVSVNILYNCFPKGGVVRKIIDIFVEFCSLLCGLFLLYYGTQLVIKLMPLPGVMPVTGIPNWVKFLPATIVGIPVTFDSILFLTGVLKPDDLMFSEPEVDYVEQVRQDELERAAQNKEAK